MMHGYILAHFPVSVLTAIFPAGLWLAGNIIYVSILDFIGVKNDRDGGDSWSYRTCLAPVKLSSSTKQYPTFYRLDALPVPKSTVSKR